MLGGITTTVTVVSGALSYPVNPALYLKPPYRSFSISPPYRGFYAAAIRRSFYAAATLRGFYSAANPRSFYVRIDPMSQNIPPLSQFDPREEAVITLDGTALLAGATFTGTPTVTVTMQAGRDNPPTLQVSGVIINAQAITVDGVVIQAGCAIQMVVKGGTFGSQYLICAVCGTSNPDVTWAMKCVLPMAAQ